MRSPIIMSDQSAPETLEVRLINRAGNPTVHKYDHTEELPAVDPSGKPDGSGFAHFYCCTQTGALKRYGFDKLGTESPEVES